MSAASKTYEMDMDEKQTVVETHVVDESPERQADGTNERASNKAATAHPNDSLTWSRRKKYITLFTITLVSFLAKFGGTIAIPATIPQAKEWHTSHEQMQRSLSIAVLCAGSGGFVSVIPAQAFGCLPVLLVFQTITTAFGILCAVATDYRLYLAARIVSGLFSGVGNACALMWIKRIFFESEHRRTINIWAGPTNTASDLGPMLSAFIIAGSSWRWSFWLYTIMNIIALMLILLFLDEPYVESNLKPQGAIQQARWESLFGLPQWKARNTREPFPDVLSRPFTVLRHVSFLAILLWCYVQNAWLAGAATASAIWLTSIYNFDSVDLGYFYFAPLIGIMLGTLIGHWAHDAAARAWTRRNAHNLMPDPESRLLMSYPSGALMALSLLVIGFALDKVWSYWVTAVFYGALSASYVVAVTAVSSYVVHAYPDSTLECGMWMFLLKCTGGFMATFVQLPWIKFAGLSTVLGTQAGLSLAATCLLGLVQVFGGRVRRWQQS